VPTAVSAEVVKRIIDTQVNLPADFTPHPRLKPLLDRRAAMREEDAIDWATGELLAFGALSWTGTRCGWSARTAGAARSASGTRCWWTGTPAPSTPR
jgi:2-oxoglutarate dehydrogenase complex, dehydrogenase (E1) component, and related enzymes